MLAYHDLSITPLCFCNNPLSFFQGLLGLKNIGEHGGAKFPGTTDLTDINAGQVSVRQRERFVTSL